MWWHRKQTDVRNTPTLVVNYGGVNGEYYWYNKMNIWENERFLKFYPRDALDARSIRRETAPEWDYYHIEVAKQAKRLRDAGIKIQIGAIPDAGLSPNWEIWAWCRAVSARRYCARRPRRRRLSGLFVRTG
jgi:hypothetical protein